MVFKWLEKTNFGCSVLVILRHSSYTCHCHAEGEKAERASEKQKLHSEEASKA